MSFLLPHFSHPEYFLKGFSPTPRPQVQSLQNVAMVLGINQVNLSQITLENFQQLELIDCHWELESSLQKDSVIQWNFRNNLTMIFLPKSLIIREKINTQLVHSLKGIGIIHRYIQGFPQLSCQSFTLNLQHIFNLKNQENFLKNYLQNTLLSPLTHQVLPNQLSQAEIQWQYTLDRCHFSLTTKIGNLLPSSQSPFLSFLGSFNYKIASFLPQERQEKLTQALDNIPLDYQTFETLIHDHFLK